MGSGPSGFCRFSTSTQRNFFGSSLRCVRRGSRGVAPSTTCHARSRTQRFYFDSDAVANLMVTALMFTLAVASFLAVRSAGHTVAGTWRRVAVKANLPDADADSD